MKRAIETAPSTNITRIKRNALADEEIEEARQHHDDHNHNKSKERINDEKELEEARALLTAKRLKQQCLTEEAETKKLANESTRQEEAKIHKENVPVIAVTDKAEDRDSIRDNATPTTTTTTSTTTLTTRQFASATPKTVCAG